MVVAAEHRYRRNEAAAKVLGAVYTPPRVAAALVRWAVRSPSDRVLDPSCGDGIFLTAARTHLADLGNRHPVCLGVDIDPQAAAASGGVCSDFFEWAQFPTLFESALTYDAIVGNPPYVRSHLFPEGSRALAFQQMQEMGLHPSRLMSTWAPFVALSVKLLSPIGRLAFVVPEELLHVGYAEELRRFLLSRFRRVIVCVPGRELFSSVQQSVVLLLCDNSPEGSRGLLTMTFEGLEEGPPYPTGPAPAWTWCSKWTHLFLSTQERLVVSECFRPLDWRPLKEYGRVEVGVVTGSNDFFIVPEAQAQALGGSDWFTPIITSARDLQGVELTGEDFRRLDEKGRPIYLMNTSEPVETMPAALQDYLAQGVAQGVHLRFKCRNREPWYAVPSVWPADALLLRQAGEMPKLVHLSKPCAATDTLHRVRWKNPAQGRLHAAGFLNTWTLIAGELTGRSYGGGVLELMPSEANNLLVPPPMERLETVFEDVDRFVRARQFSRAVEVIDRIVTPSGISPEQYDRARDILCKLIARRTTKQNGSD